MKRASLLQPLPLISSPRQLRETAGSIRSERWLPLLLVVLAGTLALLPAMLLGIPANNDLSNHYHFALPFYEAIAGGDFYPGWLASSNQGYGDPLFRFYPPGLYYLLALARSLTGNWYTASLSVFTFLSILGTLGAYFWASSFLPRHIATWAGVFYAFMPYHVAEVYQAAQIAEFAAGAALLFALAFTSRICRHGQRPLECAGRAQRRRRFGWGIWKDSSDESKAVSRSACHRSPKGRWRDVGGLAASYGVLILTHLPLAVFGSISLLAYALLSIEKGRKRETLLKLASAAGLGLAASAFYWTTVVAEMNWIVGNGAHPDPLLDYRSNFIFSTFSPEKNVTLWWMNILTIVTLAMCLPALSLFSKKVPETTRRKIMPVALLLIFTLLMATVISKPLWAVLPVLQMAQHPFRWLAVTSAAAPLLMAASIPLWWKTFRGRNRSVALALAGLVLISVTFTLSQIIRPAQYLSRSEFEQTIRPLKESPSIVQWLPVWATGAAQAKVSYDKIPPLRSSAAVEAGQRRASVISWQALRRSFQIDSGEPVEARLHTFYYPHWVAVANGQVLPTRAGEDGALLVSLPANSMMLSLDFREPAHTKASAIVSAICWTLLASLLIFGSSKRTQRGRLF